MRMVWLLMASLATMVTCADIAFEVKDVEAHQRYPWNGKVDIDFTIDSAVEGSNFAVRVEAKDTVGQTNITLTTMRYDDKIALSSLGKLPAGRHRVTWDADTDVPNVLISSLAFTVRAWTITDEVVPDNGLYMVIDLSSEAKSGMYFPVSYLTAIPNEGWTDEYKTTKLVLRRISAGKDPLGRYALTKDFYAGIFEVTRRQWELVTGQRKTVGGDTIAMGNVSYVDIRGETIGSEWPTSSEVDTTNFIGVLRTRTGLSRFDLPTEQQWEYACRAGTTTGFNTGRDDETGYKAAGWCSYYDNKGPYPVGEKLPNAWGLYDMHGNVSEWCLDWFGSGEISTETDSKGPTSGTSRVLKGGCSGGLFYEDCFSSARSQGGVEENNKGFGFRLFMTLP